jgi:aspartyl-tRNA(Asn)/glutamyl-tRNA(Gln) amidotransferase subunit A
MDTAMLPLLSASELARLIERKEVSPVEVTDAYLQRIEALDSRYNAYLTVSDEEARQAAREAEREILQGHYRGPMHGIPVAVKDQLLTQGIRTTGGSRIFADFIPEEDATVIANLKQAGAILLGKTNLTEFAITALSHAFSTPRNPWHLDRFTGGSSSGSGAATAAFLCATSLGEDTGGSIRFPATWCGLVGLRPSWGRVSRYGVMRGVWSLDTVGPISRTVEDAAITLGAIAGHDPNDPYSWDAPVPDYRQALTGDIRGLRVGVISEQMDEPSVESDVRQAVTQATTTLGELGASVESVSLPLTSHGGVVSGTILAAESAMNHRQWVRERLRDYGHDNRIGLLTGSLLPAQAYEKALRLRHLIRQQILEALNIYDVLALPTAAKTAQPIEDDPVITSKASASRAPYLFTRFFNLAGVPAISVPCGFSTEGLPIGLQLGGRVGDEATVLRVAHAYEQHTSWHVQRPTAIDLE